MIGVCLSQLLRWSWSWLHVLWSRLRDRRVVYLATDIVIAKFWWTIFAIVIDLVSLCWRISNHLVAGSVVVLQCTPKDDSPFRLIVYGLMRSTPTVFQGIDSACLTGRWPCLFVCLFTFLSSRTFGHIIIYYVSCILKITKRLVKSFRQYWSYLNVTEIGGTIRLGML